MPHTLGSVKFNDNADINNKEKGERRRQGLVRALLKLKTVTRKKDKRGSYDSIKKTENNDDR